MTDSLLQETLVALRYQEVLGYRCIPESHEVQQARWGLALYLCSLTKTRKSYKASSTRIQITLKTAATARRVMITNAKYLEKCLEWYLAGAGINNQLLERASCVRLVLKHAVYPEKVD